MLSSTRESATSETSGSARPFRALSHGAIGLRRVARHRGAIVGAFLIGGLLLGALLAPYVTRYDPNAPHFDLRLQPPSAAFPLGTDSFGRDIMSRLAYGGRISLTVGAISVILSFAVGVPLGIAAGYYGGRLDDVIMRAVDVWLAFPGLLLAIGIVAVLGPGLFQIMIAVGVTSIPIFARLIRGSILSQREADFVLAARSVGVPRRSILASHILPNSISPVIVQGTLSLATAIIDVAGLAFLGLGDPDPSRPEWGAMLTNTNEYLQVAPFLAIIPGIAIVISALGFNLIGDALREALDPKLRGRA